MAEGTTWTTYDANKMTSKEIYGKVLAELGETNDKIVGVTADLAKSTNIGNFGDRFPDRLFNVGIAEQNLFGVAAGLAKTGLIPFASTVAIFACLRGGEQVRTDIAYQNLPVKIIATHGGLSFGPAGTTHHCTEDYAIMRAIANMTVVIPADGFETAKAVRACIDVPGPFYMRVGRGFEPPLHDDENFEFVIGKAMKLHEGSDLTIITCGTPTLQALEAAKDLEAEGIRITVRYMYCPVKKTISDESDYSGYPVGERLMSYGAAAEYCLIEGAFEDSENWEKRYRDEIARHRPYEKAEGYIPARKWV